MLPDAAKLIAVLLAAASAACGTVYELYAPPGAIVNPPRTDYENPDRFKVTSSAYPLYRAKQSFAPPVPREGNWTSRTGMVEIFPSDIWVVTHRVGDRLVIYSETYQARQRKFLSGKDGFVGPYLYHLLVEPDGRVNRGWFILRNPQIVVATRDRYINLNLELRSTVGWPNEPLFEVISDQGK
jgi:hypothetical protein